MTRRSVSGSMLLALALLASPFSAATVAANPRCTALSGTLVFTSFVFTSPTTAVAEADILIEGQRVGTASAHYFGIEQQGNGVTHMNGQHEIRLPEGTLFTFDEIRLQADQKNPAVGRANSRLYIVGGTGTYANATGVLHTHGEVNLATLEGGIDFKGRVCVP